MAQSQSSNQWSGAVAAHANQAPKFQSSKMSWKRYGLDFWEQSSILLTDYLPKGQTINAGYYLSLLVHSKDILKENHNEKFTKVICSCTTTSRLTGHLQPRRN
jgi:hypothetical protein